MTSLIAEFGSGQVLWDVAWFFLFFTIWLLIVVFSDIFRSHDLSGWGKALWTIFVIVLPYLGVFVYLIARGGKMSEHAISRPDAGRSGPPVRPERRRRKPQSGRRNRPPSRLEGCRNHHGRRVPGRQGKGAGRRLSAGSTQAVCGTEHHAGRPRDR